jgi:prepilin-type N-terminal cleavage/methylation domain-containing protein
MFKRNQKGFTLIELMIVIAIIGILAAIAIPNFISYRNKAFCSRAESDATAVQAAMSSYFSEPNNVSVSSATLIASSDRPALNPSNGFTISTVAPTTSAYKIVVNDGSQRCPRSSSAGGWIYATYFGTSARPSWRP